MTLNETNTGFDINKLFVETMKELGVTSFTEFLNATAVKVPPREKEKEIDFVSIDEKLFCEDPELFQTCFSPQKQDFLDDVVPWSPKRPCSGKNILSRTSCEQEDPPHISTICLIEFLTPIPVSSTKIEAQIITKQNITTPVIEPTIQVNDDIPSPTPIDTPSLSVEESVNTALPVPPPILPLSEEVIDDFGTQDNEIASSPPSFAEEENEDPDDFGTPINLQKLGFKFNQRPASRKRSKPTAALQTTVQIKIGKIVDESGGVLCLTFTRGLRLNKRNTENLWLTSAELRERFPQHAEKLLSVWKKEISKK